MPVIAAAQRLGRVHWVPIGFFLACLGPMARPTIDVFDDLDERLAHHPTIQRFAGELPWPDLTDYPSAMTPLYHLLLAPVAWLLPDNLLVLRLINLALSSLTLLVVLRTLAVWGSAATAWPCAIVLAASPYFVGPGIRLSTDNLALLFVVATLAVVHPRAPSDAPGRAGTRAALAVLTRQVHAWLILPTALRGLREAERRWDWVIAAFLPAACLLPFVAMWGGLTPPSFASSYAQGLNLDVLLFILGILGVYGVFFGGWSWPLLRHQVPPVLAAAVVGGAVVLLAGHSMPWQDDRERWGGAIWAASRLVPALQEVPLTFWLTVPVGALTLTTFAYHPDRRHGVFLVVVTLAWIAANLMSARAYQKYYDPFILFLLAAFVQGQGPGPGQRDERARWAGPALLVVLLLGIDLFRFLD